MEQSDQGNMRLTSYMQYSEERERERECVNVWRRTKGKREKKSKILKIDS